ncbi:MAG TPA: rRNA adenine N-6-methyltransferase family protein [Acidocella sp.]|jgi:protein-L-isoaspartate(D-aspartate) O-methyltransferase|nr:rRNA adenine N-6-methyltransferase family protein [Acidocella sp.]
MADGIEEGPDLQTMFAFNVALLAGTTDQRIFQAFATIKREEFFGPPPWYRRTGPDSEVSGNDLAFIYEDDVIAIDRTRNINNGAPSLHARCLAALNIEEGQDILHVGAGTGYYSAILAELTGPAGHVFAFEIDPVLAGRAKENLSAWPQVAVQARSGTSGRLPAADIIYVNAGATHPCKAWIDALRPGGRLLFPFQFAAGFSGILLVKKPADRATWTSRLIRRDDHWEARFIIRANFIHCQDLPPSTDRMREFMTAFEGDSWTTVRRLYFNDKPDKTCWFKGDGWWLGT